MATLNLKCLPTRISVAILNCLLARQLCFEDASCSAILEIIPRVCGSELVACSTVTVTKCQAALKTLQAFPFFKPTCLCRQPAVDPECNSFRDFLFDHPCAFVTRKEKDPYPVETLPTCTYAMAVCHGEKSCEKILEKFKVACKTREGECRMENRDSCKEAWTGLRMTPIFGCICPNNHMKKRCDRIFSIVNHNPCVEPPPPFVMSLFVSDASKKAQIGLTRYVAPDGSLLLLTEDGTKLLTRSAAAELLRHALRVKPPLTSIDENMVTNPYRNSSRNSHPLKSDMRTTDVPLGVQRHLNLYWSSHVQSSEHHVDPGGNLAFKTIFGPDYKDEKKQISSTNTRFEDEIRGKLNLQSTCHNALTRCLQTEQCANALTPVLRKCESNSCNREGCMRALRNFYRVPKVDWTSEIAFCLCKKSESNSDGCLSAQDRLHPTCAQKPEPGETVPACHTLANQCRADLECRERLENYEQWCAVDPVTHGCAGSPEHCRSAVTAALGTELRATCACRGTEMSQLYECLGWQRLLWLNPCVVEAQSDFHIKNYGITYETTPISITQYLTPTPERQQKPTTHKEATNVDELKKEQIKETTKQEETPHVEEVITTEVALTTATVTTERTTVATTTTTLRTTTTTKATTTTIDPSKYCLVHWDEHDDQFIKMGETRRLYRSAAMSECTEICSCDSGLRVSCHTACVPRSPCSSRLAHYAHAAPAHRAFRGRCYCYSGSFICMRPDPTEYKLPSGVYLLLGYSSVDETLLRPHTGLGVEDAVRVLQDYMETLTSTDNNCTLTMFNVSNENLVIAASLPSEQRDLLKDSGTNLLAKEKEECVDILQEIKTRINTQHNDVTSHLLLSIFKIAEVDVIYPHQPSKATKLTDNLLCVFIVSIVLLYQFQSKIDHDLEEVVENLYIDIYSFGEVYPVTRVVTVFLEVVKTWVVIAATMVYEIDTYECNIKPIMRINEFKCNERYFLDDLVIVDVDRNDVIFIEGTIYKAHLDAQNAYEMNVLAAQSFCLGKKHIHIDQAVNVTIFNLTLAYFSNDFEMLFERVILNNDITNDVNDNASFSYGLA